jgi:hypothetical protein
MVPARAYHARSIADTQQRPSKKQPANLCLGTLLCFFAVVVQVGLTSTHAWHQAAEAPVTAPEHVHWPPLPQGQATPANVFAALDMRPRALSAALPCPLCWALSQSRHVVMTESRVGPLTPTASEPETVAAPRLTQPCRLPLSPRAPPSPSVDRSGKKSVRSLV